MRLHITFWISLYFAIVHGFPFKGNNLLKFKRSIDLISSLEHVSDVRLPRDVTPTGYSVELQPFPEEGEFQGHVIINITCLEDTDKIILNAHQDLEISEGDVNVEHITSHIDVKKDADTTAELTSSSPTPQSTHSPTTKAQNILSTVVTMTTGATVKTTEPYVAPVPVGAARLVPLSSSFLPENACTSATSCAANSGQEKEADKEKSKRMAKAEPLKGIPEEYEKSKTNPAITQMPASQILSEGSNPNLTPNEEILESIPQNNYNPRSVPLKVAKIERQLSKQWYVIYVSGGLKRGQFYVLDLKFTGALLTNSKDGFFSDNYIDKHSGEKRPFVATQLRPNHARRVLPCFDEPSYKVPFEIRVARNPGMAAISNMPLKQTIQSPTEPEWVWDHFQTTPPISTFSLAILVSDLQQVQLSQTHANKDDRVRVWGRKELLPSLKSAAKLAPKVLQELETYFDMPLPVPKLDLVALPGYTAIPDSDWGIIFFKESDLTNEEHLVKHVSREITYQWIGNLITPHWWSEVHLNKALCNFIAHIVSLKIDFSVAPNSGLWTKTYPLYYEYGRNQPYKQLPSQKPPKTVTKSELILRMLNYTLSSSTFQKALQQILREREYKTFTQDDIWSFLTEQAGADGNLPEPATINQIADSWINKERLPMVEFFRNYENNSAEVIQSVFIRDHLDEDITNLDENLTWLIPLVVVPQNNLNFTVMKPVAWMKDEKRIIVNDLPPSSYFVIVNPEEVGPFIVNYDTYNWNLISEFLEKYGTNGQIPAATRAKLIHDSLNLAYAGKLKFDIALNVTKFLYNEKDPIVWQAAFNLFDHIQRQLEGSQTGKKFQEYVKYILSNVYPYLEKLGSKQTKSQERMYKSAKSALCNAGYKPCIREARAHWKKWMDFQEPDSGIPISQSHFCWVFKWGTKEEWEFGFERYLKYPASLKQTDRYYLLKTLVSCPTNTWNVERLLNMTMLDPNSTITDGNTRFILNVLSNQAGYTALFNLLISNWNAIRSRYDNKESGLWNNIVRAATRNFRDQEGLDMVSELYVEKQGDFGSAEPVIEESLKHIKKQVQWNEEIFPVINKWLNSYLPSDYGASEAASLAE